MGREGFQPRKAEYGLRSIVCVKMTDMGSVGPAFTWSNKREGLAHVKEGLDNLISYRWTTLYQLTFLAILDFIACGSERKNEKESFLIDGANLRKLTMKILIVP